MYKQYKQVKRPFYRLNQYIQAPEVRVVDEKGKQIGVMTLSEALKKAGQAGLDLIEVAPNAKPPVCKIINFKKFQFLEEKKKREEKKKTKKVELKEIRLAPFIAENDLNFRLKRAEEFLRDGNRVKFNVRFKGREIDRKEFGYELLRKTVENLKSFSRVEIEPKFFGRQLEMVLLPLKGNPPSPKATEGKDDQKKDENQKIN